MTKASDPLGAQVAAACRALHLPSVGARAAALASDAAREGISHVGFLAALLEVELEDRAERRRQRRITEARFPRLKRLEEFRFADAPAIPVSQIRELATSAFVDKAENVILLGESGTP